MLTSFKLFGAVFLFIWCGNGVPTPRFLALAYTSDKEQFTELL